MGNLSTELGAIFARGFEAAGLDANLGTVRRSDKPDMADFQCNGALAGAKAAKRNPREIANEVAEAVAGQGPIASVEIAGPGFLNIRVSDEALARSAQSMREDQARASVAPVADPQNLIIDFGGANVAKPMHVGHLRTAVIGDTLQRVLRFLGDKVTSDIHMGDWGLQMGHLITELEDEQPDLPYFDAGNTGPYPDLSPVSIDDLSRLYPQASNKAKDDPERNKRSQNAVAEMQAGRTGYRALLQHFVDVSVEALKVDYGFLGVSFDLWLGEKDAEPFIPGMIEDIKARGLTKEDDGAWIIPVEREDDTKDYPPFMLLNSRGASMYHTSDLATILDRVQTYKPDRMLYVVDQRQALHFEQVFRASEIVGYMPTDRLEHLGFGTVNGKDGKPFKTRAGGTLKLGDLTSMALDEANKKIEEGGRLSADIGPEERARIGELVARAALRFADLQNTRTTNYVFDLDRFTSFEGKTGPYLLYQAVRIKSLLRKAADEGSTAGTIKIESPVERALVLTLDGFDLALNQTRDKRMPHILCEHVYNLAQSFAAFYGAHKIASEEDAALRASRLGLCEAVANQLNIGLDLLGIEAPERM
ncbi:MAG: arginine--tRNA ligase [Hyphomonadaceae bacterium]